VQDDPLIDAELEGLRRSLAMLPANQLALTRDQALDLVQRLQQARAQLERLRGERDQAIRSRGSRPPR
jgi:hypothetical protein